MPLTPAKAFQTQQKLKTISFGDFHLAILWKNSKLTSVLIITQQVSFILSFYKLSLEKQQICWIVIVD